MHVDESGTPGTPAVLLLHGAGAGGRMWRVHVERLRGWFHCLAPDLPGFGRSRGEPFVSRAVTADLVAGLVATRVPAGRAHVVGLSWGGAIARSLLDRHPGLVDRAVIDGAGVLTWRLGVLVLAGVTVAAPFLHTRAVTALFANMIGMDESGREDLRAAAPTAFRRAFAEGFRSGVSRAEVAAESPTLLVAGEHETVVRRANAALAALMPHAEARYAPGLAHGWIARDTDLHVRMVEAWLDGAPLPPGLRSEVPSPASPARLRRELGEESAPPRLR